VNFATALLMFLAAPQGAPHPPAVIAPLAVKADEARHDNRLDEAAKLYSQALAKAPQWEQGWWELGAIHYEKDEYATCRDAFRRFTSLKPSMGPGYAFLGLCEFRLKEFEPSLEHLEKAYNLGLPKGEDLTYIAIYHAAVLQAKAGNFERAIQFCRLLIREKPDDLKMVVVAGIAGLRKPLFPQEVPEAERDVTLKLGQAMMPRPEERPEQIFERFESLLKEYPATPNIRYTYSTLLLPVDPDKGLEQLKKEVELNGDNVPALISIAFEYLRRGEPEHAQPAAEQAVKLTPQSFTALTCLGRVLLERDKPDVPGAIRALEEAVRLAPDSPQVHTALATAYAKAGRKELADRERAALQKLSTNRQEVR
jgi:tetratricopeptide (TPR) repeat protein